MLTYPVFINGNQWHNQQCWILKSIHPKKTQFGTNTAPWTHLSQTHTKKGIKMHWTIWKRHKLQTNLQLNHFKHKQIYTFNTMQYSKTMRK